MTNDPVGVATPPALDDDFGMLVWCRARQLERRLVLVALRNAIKELTPELQHVGEAIVLRTERLLREYDHA